MTIEHHDDDFSDPEVWKKSGDELFKEGKYEEAIKKYEEAVKINPNYTEAWNNLGFTYFKLGKIEESKKIKDLLNEIKINPSKINRPPKNNSQQTNPIKTVIDNPIENENPPNIKSPRLAALLSVLFPGTGHVYDGLSKKGFLVLIGTIIGTIFLIIPGIAVWIYGIYDSYRTAKRVNSGEIPNKPMNIFHLGIYFVFYVIGIIVILAVIATMVSGMTTTVDTSNEYSKPYPVQTTQMPPITVSRSQTTQLVTQMPLNVYSNPNWEFSIGYPPNWQKTTYQQRYVTVYGSRVYLFPYTIIDFKPFNTNNDILYSVTIDNSRDTIEEYYVTYVSQLENNYYIDITKHCAQIPLYDHKLRGYRIDYIRKNKQDTTDIKKVIQVFTIDNNHVYILNLEAVPSKYDSYLAQFEQIIQSFKTVSTSNVINQNSCSFIGSWNWVGGKYLLIINNDGSVTSQDTNGIIRYARWDPTQDGKQITIIWEDGWTDKVGLSNNCNSLDGYNTEGARVHGDRIQ